MPLSGNCCQVLTCLPDFAVQRKLEAMQEAGGDREESEDEEDDE